MFLFQEEPYNPPIILSIVVFILSFVIIFFIFKFFQLLVQHFVHVFKNKHYYNRNLLILASKVIKADGTINKIEQGFVRNYFIKNYGNKKANRAFEQFKKVSLDKTSIEETCKKVHDLLTYQECFDFVKFLFGIAHSDGKVTQAEELEIRKIAGYLFLRKKDYIYLQSIFYKTAAASNYRQAYSYNYETIGLSKFATDLEIKKAYRTLAKKYHPDRLTNITEGDLQVAKEKFQKIQEAYEKIKKERRF